MALHGSSVVPVISPLSQPLCQVTPALQERRRVRSGLCQLSWRMHLETAARLCWSCRVRWSGGDYCAVYIIRCPHYRSHMLTVTVLSTYIHLIRSAFVSEWLSASSRSVQCCDWTISDCCLGDCHICHHCHWQSSGHHFPLPASRYMWWQWTTVCVCVISFISKYSVYHGLLQLCIEWRSLPQRRVIINWRKSKKWNWNQIQLTRLLIRHD